MLQKTEMVRRGFVNLRTSCYRSSGGPVLLKKCHGRTDFRTGPKVHATLFSVKSRHCGALNTEGGGRALHGGWPFVFI